MSAGAAPRYALDPAVRRGEGGRLLSGGVPARLTRLTAAGVAALDAALAGEPLDPPAAALARRLERAGTIHPLPPEPAPPAALTTVIPVRDGGPGLGALVAALRARGEVIVVDDRSADGSAERARAAGARVIANDGAPGPAGARNRGLAAARGELVAFVDADCRPAPGWSDGLAALLGAEPRLALAAPRVRSAPAGSALARYETLHSPLDLGPLPSEVGPGRRVTYLPAAALVGRREALLAVGGFDERLRYGEDVDLVCRLRAAGWRARYVPRCQVLHLPRAGLAGVARQRAGYGSSAPRLERLHPGVAAPLRASRGAASAWLTAAALGAAAGPGAALGGGGAVALANALRAARAGGGPEARRSIAALALRGQAAAGAQLARAVSREWLPLSALACLRGPGARRVLAAALLIDAYAAARRDGLRLDPARLVALRALDSAAYSAGLWRAALAERSVAALLPRPLSR